MLKVSGQEEGVPKAAGAQMPISQAQSHGLQVLVFALLGLRLALLSLPFEMGILALYIGGMYLFSGFIGTHS